MGKFRADMRDIEFNLMEVLKVQDWKQYGLEENDMKGILNEYVKFVEKYCINPVTDDVFEREYYQDRVIEYKNGVVQARYNNTSGLPIVNTHS